MNLHKIKDENDNCQKIQSYPQNPHDTLGIMEMLLLFKRQNSSPVRIVSISFDIFMKMV